MTAAGVPTGNTYAKYATTNPIERWMMSGFLGCLDRALPSVSPGRVLEVGVGEGEIADRVERRFPAARVFGMDLPDQKLAAAWSGRRLCGSFGDIASLPYADSSMDLVLAIEVLEHVPDPEAALREIRRVTRGRVVLSVPWEPIWRIGNMVRGRYIPDWGNTPGHIQHWNRRGFVGLVGKFLRVEQVFQPVPWTMVVASR